MGAKSLFSMFGRSPIYPLQEHMHTVFSCVNLLEDFFKAVIKKDWQTVTVLRQKIADQESTADTLKRKLCLNLPRGLFMAINRADILGLVTTQDKMANKAKDIAGIICGRKMALPEVIHEKFLSFLELVITASKKANKAINELNELLETGFSDKEISIVNTMVTELSLIERYTDAMQIEIRYLIFQIEKDLSPIDVIFLYKILEWIGSIANIAQHVGDKLQVAIVR